LQKQKAFRLLDELITMVKLVKILADAHLTIAHAHYQLYVNTARANLRKIAIDTALVAHSLYLEVECQDGVEKSREIIRTLDKNCPPEMFERARSSAKELASRIEQRPELIDVREVFGKEAHYLLGRFCEEIAESVKRFYE